MCWKCNTFYNGSSESGKMKSGKSGYVGKDSSHFSHKGEKVVASHYYFKTNSIVATILPLLPFTSILWSSNGPITASLPPHYYLIMLWRSISSHYFHCLLLHWKKHYYIKSNISSITAHCFQIITFHCYMSFHYSILFRKVLGSHGNEVITAY